MELHARSFPDGAILSILLCLEQRDIVRAQLVCRQWHGVAQLARKDAFLRRWGFSALLTEPRSLTLLETIPATSIVRRHVVSPGENVPQLALRFQVGPMELMRLNNLMAPHLLQHRHFVYVPVAAREEIRGCYAAFEYSPLLCRDVLVAQEPPGAPPPGSDSTRLGAHAAAAAEEEEPGAEQVGAVPPVTFNRMLLREMQAHVRRLIQEGPRGGGGNQRQQQQQQATTSGLAPTAAAATVSLDLAAARFYLREAEGCAEAAARAFVADVSWEQRRAAKKAAAVAATVEGGGRERGDESYEYDDAEYGPEDEDTVLVQRNAACVGARDRPSSGRLLRMLRRGVRLLSCGFCGRPGRRDLPRQRPNRCR